MNYADDKPSHDCLKVFSWIQPHVYHNPLLKKGKMLKKTKKNIIFHKKTATHMIGRRELIFLTYNI